MSLLLRLGAASALVALTCVGCNRQFDFDVPGAAGGGGFAGAAGSGGATSSSVPTLGYKDVETCIVGCREHGLVCVEQALICVECNLGSDCTRAERPRCDAALHRCVQCGSTSDCPSGFVCESTSHRCVQTCHEDESSESGQAGRAGTDDSSGCPAGSNCSEAGLCVSCAGDGDCVGSSSGQHCAPSIHQCVECAVDANCAGSTPYCDPVELRCVGCRDSSDCKTGRCDAAQHTCC